MKVLVIGATGYVGHAVAQALLRHGHTVVATLRDPNAASRLPSGVATALADVTNPASLVAAAQDADAVVYSVQYNDADQFEVESKALNALNESLAPGKKRFIYTSGVWYHGSTYPNVADESSPANPPAVVARRPELEAIALQGTHSGVRAIVIRPAVVYGRGVGIPAMWVQSARETGAARIIGDGGNHWTMIHVEDLANLYVLALERGKVGAVYNAVDDSRFTVREMAEAASRGAGKAGEVLHVPVEEARAALGPFADALALDQLISNTKAKAELGWAPHAASALEDLEHGSYAGAGV